MTWYASMAGACLFQNWLSVLVYVHLPPFGCIKEFHVESYDSWGTAYVPEDVSSALFHIVAGEKVRHLCKDGKRPALNKSLLHNTIPAWP